MKDLRKMDIEGIERHVHNYKLLTWFLKNEGKYPSFRKYIFTDQKRTPLQLFMLMNSINEDYLNQLTKDYPFDEKIDKMWSRVLSYVPFGFLWISKPLCYNEVLELDERWVKFLKEHNYDNFRFKT